MTYACGIATRGRREPLLETVSAILFQTLPPDALVIVDNNDDPEWLPSWLPNYQRFMTDVYVIRSGYGTGLEDGKAAAFDWFKEGGYAVGMTWDDDLVPERECFAKMFGVLGWLNVAVGGMYPRDGDNRVTTTQQTGDRDPKHFQFFKWGGPAYIVRDTRFLYSSFMYNVAAVEAVGGICTDYSPIAYRAETDLTLRLSHEYGSLLIVTAAVAWHKVAPGGCRNAVDLMKHRRHDLELFEKRMKERGIDPNY